MQVSAESGARSAYIDDLKWRTVGLDSGSGT